MHTPWLPTKKSGRKRILIKFKGILQLCNYYGLYSCGAVHVPFFMSKSATMHSNSWGCPSSVEVMYLCCRITRKAINGQRSHQNDFTCNFLMNVPVEETISTGKPNILSPHFFYFSSCLYLLRRILKPYFV